MCALSIDTSHWAVRTFTIYTARFSLPLPSWCLCVGMKMHHFLNTSCSRYNKGDGNNIETSAIHVVNPPPKWHHYNSRERKPRFWSIPSACVGEWETRAGRKQAARQLLPTRIKAETCSDKSAAAQQAFCHSGSLHSCVTFSIVNV